MKIESIQVGKPKILEFNGKKVETGIFKNPVPGPVMLRTLNLDGDGQADLKVHGGRDKALYAYSLDAYPDWQQLRPQDKFPFGAMGENLSVTTLPEINIYVGDVYKLGDSVIQATQPRFPCHKLGIKFKDMKILKQFTDLGRPGVYFRVLEEGLINVGDHLELMHREKVLLSVLELFRLEKLRTSGPKKIREIMTIQSLPEPLKQKLLTWIQ